MQVAIREENQSALRFLWLEIGIVCHYQYIRLILCATCSPCCAIFALHRCAADLSDRFPDVYEAVLKKFYIDDFIRSFANAEDDRRLASNLHSVLQHGGFRLKKVVSNNPAAFTALPEEDKEIIQKSCTQRKSLVKLGVFRMTRSQLQCRKQSTRRKRFDNCSAWFHQFSILLDCSLLS